MPSRRAGRLRVVVVALVLAGCGVAYGVWRARVRPAARPLDEARPSWPAPVPSEAASADSPVAGVSDPPPPHAETLEDLITGLERNPDQPEAWHRLGLAYRRQGEAEAEGGMDPRPAYEKSAAALGESQARLPGREETLNALGEVYQLLAAEEGARGGDVRPVLAGAIATFDNAIGWALGNSVAYLWRGNLHMRLGEAEAAAGVDARESFKEAVMDFTRASNMDRTAWKAFANRGLAYEKLEEWDMAVSSYEAALRIVGDAFPPLEEWLAKARARQGGR